LLSSWLLLSYLLRVDDHASPNTLLYERYALCGLGFVASTASPSYYTGLPT